MKKASIFVFVFISFIFTSCVDDLADVKFNTKLEKDIEVNLVDQTTIDQSIVMSLDNSDTHDYLDMLKKVKIKSLKYKFTSYSGDDNGIIDLVISSDGTQIHTVNDVNVKNATSAATEYQITDTTAMNNIASALLNNQSISLKGTGTADYNGEMHFKIHIVMDLEVTANPL